MVLVHDDFPMPVFPISVIEIIPIFHSDWIDCRGISCNVLHFNAVYWAEHS